MDTQPTHVSRHHEIVRVSGEHTCPLTFAAVDGIAFAAERSKQIVAPKKNFVANELGPFLELMHLSQDKLVPSLDSVSWFSLKECSELYAALQIKIPFWVCSRTQSIGALKVSEGRKDETIWLKFVSAAQKATTSVGFSRNVGLQLVAAIEELIDNIEVHSKRLDSGWAVFRAENGRFEFVVSDRGIGVLSSLKENPEFSNLRDHGDALQMALTDGYSRYGKGTQHGNGFRPLFTGLSNMSGSLRFRTGDHALLINGQNPKVIPWTKAAKPKLTGFLTSVSCSVERR